MGSLYLSTTKGRHMDKELSQTVVDRWFGIITAKNFTFSEVTQLVAGNDDWLDSWLSATGGAA